MEPDDRTSEPVRLEVEVLLDAIDADSEPGEQPSSTADASDKGLLPSSEPCSDSDSEEK